MARSHFLSELSYGKKFMVLVEDLGAKVNIYRKINEYMNICFCSQSQDHFMDFNQQLSDFDSF